MEYDDYDGERYDDAFERIQVEFANVYLVCMDCEIELDDEDNIAECLSRLVSREDYKGESMDGQRMMQNLK